MIDAYLNQKAVWKAVNGINAYGEAVYAVPVEIRCRIESGNRRTVNKQGEEITSTAVLYCKEAVRVGDAVVYDGQKWMVKNVLAEAGFDGKLLYYEVLL